MSTITIKIDDTHPQSLAAQMGVTGICSLYASAIEFVEVVPDAPKRVEVQRPRVVALADYRKVRVMPHPHAPFPGLAS